MGPLLFNKSLPICSYSYRFQSSFIHSVIKVFTECLLYCEALECIIIANTYLVISMFQALTILSTFHTLVHLALITPLWDGLTYHCSYRLGVTQDTQLISDRARILTPAASSRVKCPDPYSVSIATYASLGLWVFCNNKSNVSCSPGAHRLITVFIHSAYVINLIDGEKNHNSPFASMCQAIILCGLRMCQTHLSCNAITLTMVAD